MRGRLVKQAMKQGIRRMPNHQLVQQSEYAADVLDAAFMHPSFTPEGQGSQMGILTAEDIFNIRFEEE